MTLDQIVDVVTKKLGQFDADTLTICGIFVNRRYEMIYDSRDWLDAMTASPITLTAGQSIYDTPVLLDRIETLQTAAGVVIAPTNYQFMLESYPNLLLDSGVPKFYEEGTRNDLITRIFSLYPIPDRAYNLIAYGKRAFVPLTGSDKPVMRNIDNVLIAFGYFDMLQRLRQFEKAKLVLDEATTALQLMTDVETKRANRPRASKAVTVAGDSLSEMTDAVSCRIGDYTPETRILIQEYIRRNYLEIYDSQLWPESKVIVQLDRDGSEVILPSYVDRVISIRQNMNLPELDITDETAYFQIDPQIFERTGSPVAFNVLTSVGVAVLPPQTEQLGFTSDSGNDLGTIFIRGESGGVEVHEEVTLNGMVPVTSGYVYDTPLTISKGNTIGKITVFGFMSHAFLLELYPDELERKHVRLWLQPTPRDQDGTKCLMLGKRRIRPLISDEDTPILTGIGTTLIHLSTADIMERTPGAAATSMRSKAEASVETIVNREMKQTAYAPRIIPIVEPSYDPLGWGGFEAWGGWI